MQFSNNAPADRWLGLTTLGSVLTAVDTDGAQRMQRRPDEEVLDRLYRTLEVLALVEDNAGRLQKHADAVTHHEAMQIAGDLRRLANRLQAFGDFLVKAGQAVIGLEDRILVELDRQFRSQNSRSAA
jgi:hypothetical protein